MKINLFAFSLVAAFLVGNVYKFQLPFGQINISFLDIFVVIFSLIVWIVRGSRIVYWCRSNPKFFRSIAIFFSLGVISLVVALTRYKLVEVFTGSAYLLRWLLYSLLPASFVQVFKVDYLRKLVLFLGLGTTFMGLGQYLIFPDVRALVVAEWDPHYFRIVGTLLDPGFTGLILVFTLIYLTVNQLRDKGLQAVVWGLSYVSLALTYSRSAYLAFLVAMGYLSWKEKGWKFFISILVLFTCTIYILPRYPDGEGVKLERTNSIQARIDSWLNALTIFKDHPLVGVGFNTYRYAQRDYGFLTSSKWQISHAGAGADSSLLLVAATTGIVGLLAYLWYGKQLVSVAASDLTLRASLVGLVVHSAFLNSLFYPAVMLWIAVLVALTVWKSL